MFHDLWLKLLALFKEDSDTDAESSFCEGDNPDTFVFAIFSSGGNKIKVENMNINFVGAGTETIQASGFVDASGNPTTQHGSIVFSSSDESIATVSVAADDLTATITGTGKVGTCTITATDSKDNASAVANVATVAGEAVSFHLNEVVAPVTPVAPVAAPAVAPVAPAVAPVADAAATTAPVA